MAFLAYPRIDPVLMHVGPVAIRWYGLAYLFGLLLGLALLRRDARKRDVPITSDDAVELVLWLALGLLVGARLGYAAAYDLKHFLARPQDIIAIWTGGMSFHGGLLGAIAGGWVWTRRRERPFYPLADIVTAAAPIGLFLGRLANFVNDELWGRPSTLPWAMVFPNGGPLTRHPSQLYEALLEGVVLFVVLRLLLRARASDGVVFWSFIGLYGLFRFAVEFTRQPDPQLGYLLGHLSMGQLLSMPMVVGGSVMLWWVSAGRAGRAET
jgi:phosphatidylglycerol---prolipoprotein diacylglyceryl transferase